MAAPMTTGLPEALDLTKDYQIEFTALDASTGADVTSVVVSNASLLVTNVVGGDLSADMFTATPLWVPIPNDQLSQDGGTT